MNNHFATGLPRHALDDSPNHSDPVTQGARICRRITQHHARTFFLASQFLPRSTREHAYAVYGFCRWADDAVDCARDANEAFRRLDRVRQVLDEAYGPAPTSPGVEAFRRTIRGRSIPRILFDELLVGMEMDLSITRYPDYASLERYCYRVAGVVGLMMTHVFGFCDSRCLPRAEAMGRAMQLTNILRDVGEDLGRGRIYLPQSELAEFGVTEADLVSGRVDDRFRELMRFQIRRARRDYEESEAGIADLRGSSHRLTVRVMGRLYRDILRSIERRDFDVFRGRARVSRVRKLRLLVGCQARNGGDQLRRIWE